MHASSPRPAATLPPRHRPHPHLLPLRLALPLLLASCPAAAQEASVTSAVAPTGQGAITIEARGILPKPAPVYTAESRAEAAVSTSRLAQTITLKVRILQGTPGTLSFGLGGPGEIRSVSGAALASWAVRRQGEHRFLDLQLQPQTNAPAAAPPSLPAPVPGSGPAAAPPAPPAQAAPAQPAPLEFTLELAASELRLPATVELAHLTPGGAAGFTSEVSIRFEPDAEGRLHELAGFVPVQTRPGEPLRLHFTTGGRIALQAARRGSFPPPAELTGAALTGIVHEDRSSVTFTLRGTAEVREPDAVLTILRGQASIAPPAAGPGPAAPRLTLALDGGQPAHQLRFPGAGRFPVQLEIAAALIRDGEWRGFDFELLPGCALLPVTLSGLPDGAELREGGSILPPDAVAGPKPLTGHLPASGTCRLAWRPKRQAGEGKLFFSSTAFVETAVSTGAVRQDHEIAVSVLQGELAKLDLAVEGDGEILAVDAPGLLAWNAAPPPAPAPAPKPGNAARPPRQVSLSFSKPVKGALEIRVRTQSPLSALPATARGTRVTPAGTLRHSGHLRVSNQGSVSLQSSAATGLIQLAPEQLPKKQPVQARQAFVYRFPSAAYSFEFAVAQVRPEIHISQQTVYRVGEAERSIQADLELDIREAPVREASLLIPADYSLVSLTGNGLLDYVVSPEVSDGRRGVRVIYGEDVSGRQLLQLALEKSQPAAAGAWALPPLGFPDAKSVRGDVGVAASPGLRLSAGAVAQLAEKSPALFPGVLPDLQLAYRIRAESWSASVEIATLPRNVQADVFHLFTLRDRTAFASVLINYFVTGAPVAEWEIQLPRDAADVANVAVDGRGIRTWRVEQQRLTATLQQPVIGPYTLLVTYERKLPAKGGVIRPGELAPLGVAGESGYLQVVSPVQLSAEVTQASPGLLRLETLELPAEFQLLSATPAHATFQYTARPFTLEVTVDWFTPGTTIPQIVEFAEVTSRVARDSELVSDFTYFVKSRGQHNLRLRLPDKTRLWSASVDRQPVSARRDGDATLIPLAGGADLNTPAEVRIRLGAAAEAWRSGLELPRVAAPVLKTEWTLQGDEGRLLVPAGGTVRPVQRPRPPSGFSWIGRHALGESFAVLFLAVVGLALARRRREARLAGVVLALAAAAYAASLAGRTWKVRDFSTEPLRYSLPSLPADEAVSVQVSNLAASAAPFSAAGLTAMFAGIAVACAAGLFRERRRRLLRTGGTVLATAGLLAQPRGATWFFLLAAAVLLLLILPAILLSARHLAKSFRAFRQARRNRKRPAAAASAGSGGALLLLLGALLLWPPAGRAGSAQPPAPAILPGFSPLDAVEQTLTFSGRAIAAKATARLTGREGDRFLLLRAPATLTAFQAAGVRLSKLALPDGQTGYVAFPGGDSMHSIDVMFSYSLERNPAENSFSLPTGIAASQSVTLIDLQPGWRFSSPAQTAALAAPAGPGGGSGATLQLAPQAHPAIERKLQERDPSREETKFHVESEQLFLVSPGVVDGRHALEVRPSQGQLTNLRMTLPERFTVSEVSGPVDSWQFDAATRSLQVSLNAPQSSSFTLEVTTQGSLDPLPAETSLGPALVPEAAGQSGLIAIACGPDAQLESIRAAKLAAVPPGDFPGARLKPSGAVPQQVYRFDPQGGSVTLRAVPVAPQVRAVTQEVLSLGEERLVLAVNAEVEITRSGVFELRFPLPAGLEVESLTGASLHHWAELEQDKQTWIVLHLQGKTLGRQTYNITLAGNSPPAAAAWTLPRVTFADVSRQTGQLAVRPAPGLRLRTVSRRNVSEIDPRALGGQGRDALAFRLLQADWEVQLGIEQLEPWITGQALHEVTFREGQSRSVVHCRFQVENAPVRTLRFRLPGPAGSADARKTVRATGKSVSGLVQPDPADAALWEIQFKRRVLGEAEFRIEFEERLESEKAAAALAAPQFPSLRQLAAYHAVRSSGRLDLTLPGELPQGWQAADWSSVPARLRTAGNPAAPALTLRSVDATSPLPLQLQRHSLAEALKLRVARGTLITVLSPLGDELTGVDLQLEVVQRSSLAVALPVEASLFNIFVNGESVHAVQQNGACQFYVLPGPDDRTAAVRFVFAVPGRRPWRIQLTSPRLNVPLENMEWNVVLPQGFVLASHRGDLELKRSEARGGAFTRASYLKLAEGKRSALAQQAEQLLEEANSYIQKGEQQRARRALSAVTNQAGLDAASNEDARVQLENLQTQQAVVGLNTRRQRLYLDNDASQLPGADQVEAAISGNRILREGDINFKPQDISQLLQGNTAEDNTVLQRIAGRLVQHQKSTEPAPPAITTILPEEGTAYTFRRAVQVKENAPLELRLRLASTQALSLGRGVLLAVFLLALAGAIHLLLFTRLTPPPRDG